MLYGLQRCCLLQQPMMNRITCSSDRFYFAVKTFIIHNIEFELFVDVLGDETIKPYTYKCCCICKKSFNYNVFRVLHINSDTIHIWKMKKKKTTFHAMAQINLPISSNCMKQTIINISRWIKFLPKPDFNLPYFYCFILYSLHTIRIWFSSNPSTQSRLFLPLIRSHAHFAFWCYLINMYSFDLCSPNPPYMGWYFDNFWVQTIEMPHFGIAKPGKTPAKMCLSEKCHRQFSGTLSIVVACYLQVEKHNKIQKPSTSMVKSNFWKFIQILISSDNY